MYYSLGFIQFNEWKTSETTKVLLQDINNSTICVAFNRELTLKTNYNKFSKRNIVHIVRSNQRYILRTSPRIFYENECNQKKCERTADP